MEEESNIKVPKSKGDKTISSNAKRKRALPSPDELKRLIGLDNIKLSSNNEETTKIKEYIPKKEFNRNKYDGNI